MALAGADGPEDVVLCAKEMTCQVLLEQRGGESEENEGAVTAFRGSVQQVFAACLRHILDAKEKDARETLFGDPELLMSTVVGKFGECEAIAEGHVAERAAADVLTERLASLEPPELFLIAGFVLEGPVDGAGSRWLQAIEGTVPNPKNSARTRRYVGGSS